jgi:phage shock protein C
MRSPSDWQRRSGPYRSRHGLILGVCKGLARYMDCSVFLLRLIVVVIALLSAFWPVVLIYLLVALVMKPEPILHLETEAEAEFYGSFANSRRMAVHPPHGGDRDGPRV